MERAETRLASPVHEAAEAVVETERRVGSSFCSGTAAVGESGFEASMAGRQ